MTTSLTLELQKQIKQEAKSSAADFCYHPGSSENEDLESAYVTGASKYTALWQAAEASAKARGEIITQLNNRLTNIETALREAEAKADRHEKALKEILSQLAPLCLKTHIAWRNTAIELCNEALTPKQTTDDQENDPK